MADAPGEHQSESEAELVRAAQGGCPAAFTELFRRHYPAVRRACRRRLGNSVDADEAAQVTFVKALERIEQCDGQRRFGPWVHVIAHRVCVDTVRARARTHVEAVPVPADRPSTDAGDPEESILVQERVRLLMDALAQLPDRQREAVVARTVDERGPGEIAAELGLSVGAVDSLLLRARRRLARAYRRVADERGAAAASAMSAATVATVASSTAARPRRVVSAVSSALGHVQHNALQLASTVGMLPSTRPAGTGVATAVLTAVLAVHTAAPPPPVADREAPFASPPPSVITPLEPVPPVSDESVGASAVSGSLTALVGGLLDAARPPAPDDRASTAADAPAPASVPAAPPFAADERRNTPLLALAEAVLGPVSNPSHAAGEPATGAEPTADVAPPALAAGDPSTDVAPAPKPPAGTGDAPAAPAPTPAPGPASAADPAVSAPGRGPAAAPEPAATAGGSSGDTAAAPPAAGADPPTASAADATRGTDPPATGSGLTGAALRTVQDVRDGLKKLTP